MVQLTTGQVWELQDGDILSFGGPESIVASSSQVSNPFIFKYSSQLEDLQTGDTILPVNENVAGTSDLQVGVKQKWMRQSRTTYSLMAEESIMIVMMFSLHIFRVLIKVEQLDFAVLAFSNLLGNRNLLAHQNLA